MKKFVLISACWLATALSLQAQTAADEQAVRNVIEQGIKQTEAKNVDGLLALYSDQASSILYNGMVITGKTAIREAMIQYFAYQTSVPGSTKIEFLQTRFLSPSQALVLYSLQGSDLVEGKRMDWKGVGSAVLSKTGGVWKVELEQATPVMDMPAGSN